MTSGHPLLLAVALLFPTVALAGDDFDHRNALGVYAAQGGEIKTLVNPGSAGNAGALTRTHLGVTAAIGEDGNELKLWLELDLLRGVPGSSVGFGHRGYFGDDRFRTFLDVDLRANFEGAFTLGPHVGIGLQFEVLPFLGVFLATAAHLAMGQGIRIGASANAGLQLRAPVLFF
jgi:hypothetical protein